MDKIEITVNGPERQTENNPLWQASVEVIVWGDSKGHFEDHTPIRNLLAGSAPLDLNDEKVLLPGTMVALCRVKKVEVYLDKKYEWKEKKTGNNEEPYHTLLLLQAPDRDWISGQKPNQSIKFPPCTCISGEIDLDRMTELSSGWKKIFNLAGSADIPKVDHLKAHSSGMSLTGESSFNWDAATRIKGVFLVTFPFPDKKGLLHVALDREFMLSNYNHDASISLDNFKAPFRKLSELLTGETNLNWSNLDLTNKDIPQFYWIIKMDDPDDLELQFGDGEWELVIADQSPNRSSVFPRGLLTASPLLKIAKSEPVPGSSEKLIISFQSQPNPSAVEKAAADKSFFELNTDSNGRESAVLKNHKVVYDPLAAAIVLRLQYDLPEPVPGKDSGERNTDPIEPAVLWGTMPLEDGWAQLPFLNVTEQIYFDTIISEDPPKAPPLLFQGAATFGNDSTDLYKFEKGDRPWNFSLLNGEGYEGKWVIDLKAPIKIESKSFTISEPEIALNGFLWLGTQTPRAEDALPGLDNWFTDLQQVSLRTIKNGEQFPSPYILNFSEIEFAKTNLSEGNAARMYSYPDLGKWEFRYQENPKKIQLRQDFVPGAVPKEWIVLRALLTIGFKIDLVAYENNQPLVWRRHPNVPAIQALPLTQNKPQPNYPNSSRQLAPFGLPFKIEDTFPLPGDWRFGVDAKGAMEYARCTSQLKKAQQWANAKFLWLASLSVPGLIFDPNSETGLIVQESDFLPAQYLYGLPYTDEKNAFSQLPKDKKNGQETSPQEPPPALKRETYAEYWSDLSEKAYLAKHDADEMLAKDGHTYVKGLVEPYRWAVTVKLDENYPGALTFTEDGGHKIELNKDTTLRGISGKFKNNGNALELDEVNPKYEITAGSMSAAFNSGDASMRDQRGLSRFASAPLQAGSSILKTDLRREGADGGNQVSLYSLRHPIDLKLQDNNSWGFWMRDVPVSKTGKIFNRSASLSALTQDVNDTEAGSTEKVYLSGYEWRLGNQGPSDAAEKPPHLDLFGFHFYPMTLEKVAVDDTKITEIELIGRLQLPIDGDNEIVELGNAVKLIFKNDGQLHLSEIMNREKGIWNLTQNPTAYSPRLVLNRLAFKEGKFSIDARLEFYLFGARWSLPEKRIEFKPGEAPSLIYENLDETGDENIKFTRVELMFDDKMKPKSLSAQITFIWGSASTALDLKAVSTIIFFDPSKSSGSTEIKAFLSLPQPQPKQPSPLPPVPPKEIPLETIAQPINKRALQLHFTTKTGQHKDLYLLSGMGLSEKEIIKGFAAMSFDIENGKLKMNYGCAEMIVPCSWGESLQNTRLEPSRQRVFGSSAGDLYAGYTMNSSNGKWASTLLLNGVFEVKNILSYPVVSGELEPDLQKIHFDSNASAIDMVRVNKIKDFMLDHPHLSISIEGHTDSDGDPDKNLELSKERVDKIKKVLTDASISKDRIMAAGFGEIMPVDTNATVEGKKNNRRAELHIFPTFHPATTAKPLPTDKLPKLDHTRHTIRVLLNQHEVPSEALAKSLGNVLFNFGEKKAWQFLSIVEHELIDVAFDAAGNIRSLSNDRRWTVPQEVRITTPENYSGHLKKISDDKLNTIFPTESGTDAREYGEVSSGFHY